MGANDNWGGCCGQGGRSAKHCDSSCYQSSCSDQGQAYPLSIRVGCSLPGDYTPIPGIVAVWNGEEWMLDTDSSSSDS